MSKTFETPKGTRDFLPDEMRVRKAVFSRLQQAFERFGYDELDTPAFEYLEALTLKSGPQAENEIYSFIDKGGRKLGLRFDLTASTGRVMANHPELKRPVYRYQIGKVWRYDRPSAGRYREFYQADADIIGSDSMYCEIELLLLGIHVLEDFGLTDCFFYVNHRKILDAQVRLSGISIEKKGDALRALDKIDKIGESATIDEAVKYGIGREAFEQFLKRMQLQKLENGSPEKNMAYLTYLKQELASDEVGMKGVSELSFIFEKMQELGYGHRLIMHPMLARGLDYYTGPIFEARAAVGDNTLSFAGGGRYDDLIELYGGQKQGAVGFSFGVERLISLIKQQELLQAMPVLVIPVGLQYFVAAEKIAGVLRQQGINVRVAVKDYGVGKQLQYANSVGIKRAMLVGEREVSEEKYLLKYLDENREESLSIEEIIKKLGV